MCRSVVQGLAPALKMPEQLTTHRRGTVLGWHERVRVAHRARTRARGSQKGHKVADPAASSCGAPTAVRQLIKHVAHVKTSVRLFEHLRGRRAVKCVSIRLMMTGLLGPLKLKCKPREHVHTCLPGTANQLNMTLLSTGVGQR